jgi:hypothetical protein
MRSLPFAGPALALMLLRTLPDLPAGTVAAVYHTCSGASSSSSSNVVLKAEAAANLQFHP